VIHLCESVVLTIRTFFHFSWYITATEDEGTIDRERANILILTHQIHYTKGMLAKIVQSLDKPADCIATLEIDGVFIIVLVINKVDAVTIRIKEAPEFLEEGGKVWSLLEEELFGGVQNHWTWRK